MFLQALEGSWLSHPFWKTKFVLADAAELATLKASGVPAVWIDVSKGCDVPAPAPKVQVVAQSPAVAPAPAPATPEPSAHFEDEIGRAAEVLYRSKQAVMALLDRKSVV